MRSGMDNLSSRAAQHPVGLGHGGFYHAGFVDEVCRVGFACAVDRVGFGSSEELAKTW